MPKSRPAPARSRTTAELKSPVERVRDAADALFRAAVEVCHQHDRLARIHKLSSLDDEVRAAQAVCARCHEALTDLTTLYERSSSEVHPDGADEQWWRRANALWLASREYLRRNGGCDSASRQLKEHGPDRLGELHAEFELEASALLGMRQAADAYLQARPAAG